MVSVIARGQSPESLLHVGGLVCRFSHVLCLCGRVEIFPLVCGARVRTRFQHRVRHDEEEGGVCDKVITRSTLGFILGSLECIYVLRDSFAVRVIFLHLDLEREDVNCVKSAADCLEVVQKLSRGDLCEQVFLVLQFEDPRFVDHVKDQRACLELCLGVQLVVVHARLPRDLFLPKDGRLVFVRNRWVIYCRSCGAMESQVSLVSCLVFARRTDEADEILVSVILIVRSEEEDGYDDGSDLE